MEIKSTKESYSNRLKKERKKVALCIIFVENENSDLDSNVSLTTPYITKLYKKTFKEAKNIQRLIKNPARHLKMEFFVKIFTGRGR